MFELKIRTDGATFEDDPRPEVGRILRRIADRIERGEDRIGRGDGTPKYRTVFDINGNDVGRFKLS